MSSSQLNTAREKDGFYQASTLQPLKDTVDKTVNLQQSLSYQNVAQNTMSQRSKSCLG